MIYPYTDMPQDSCRDFEHQNRVIRNAQFGPKDDILEERFFNCSFIDCEFYIDQMLSTVFLNCHFQGCSIHTYKRPDDDGKLPFSNTIFTTCSFRECEFSEFYACYGVMTNCIFDTTNFRDVVMAGFHLSDFHMKNCQINNLSFRSATIPLMMVKDCTSTGLDFTHARVCSLTFAYGRHDEVNLQDAEVHSLKSDHSKGDFCGVIKETICAPDFDFQ